MFNLTIILSNLLIPITMVAGGWWLKAHPIQQINNWAGYRSTRSKRNKETWAFAQQYAGNLWLKTGFITGLLTIIATFFLPFHDETLVGNITTIFTFIQLGIMMSTIYFVEKALKSHFDEDGKPLMDDTRC